MPTEPPQPAKSLLVLIGADPRTSDRAAEAIRVAAGIGAWKKVRVNLYLHGPALACATEPPENLEAGELIAEHLPSIAGHGGRIFAERALQAGGLAIAAESPARLAAAHDARMNFGVPPAVLGLSPEDARLTGGELFDALFDPAGPGREDIP